MGFLVALVPTNLDYLAFAPFKSNKRDCRVDMSWEDEQYDITREGRLHLAPPEMVFAELKELSRRSRAQWSSTTEALEAMLIERNEPLINLGLACYGTNEDVFRALYKHSKELPRDTADALYKRNLRLGCLSNQTIACAHFIFTFPHDLIGEQEVIRLLSEAEPPELNAMVSNPTVSDSVARRHLLHERPRIETVGRTTRCCRESCGQKRTH